MCIIIMRTNTWNFKNIEPAVLKIWSKNIFLLFWCKIFQKGFSNNFFWNNDLKKLKILV
jgi:hypothetical protein